MMLFGLCYLEVTKKKPKNEKSFVFSKKKNENDEPLKK